MAQRTGEELSGMSARSSPVFIGRRRELATLLRTLKSPPALVLISGEPGIGKTRLVEEWLRDHDDGVALVAVCPPLPEPFPLCGLTEALRRVRHRALPGQFSELTGALRSLLPEWGPDLPPAPGELDDPVATRHLLLRAVIEVLEHVGTTVLVIEDAHWADTATLELLLMLSASARPGMSIVVTYRVTEVSDRSLLWRLTSQQPSGLVRVGLELCPLDVREAGELVTAMCAFERVSPQLAGYLHQRTAGVPLALVEMVSALRERRDLLHAGDVWTPRALAQLNVPPTVRDSVLERLGRLAPAARRLLRAAAVLAEPADEALLGSVAGLSHHVTQRGLAVALRSGLLQEAVPGKFGFRHSLAQDAVASAIPAPQRRRLHAGAVVALREWDPPPVVLLTRHCREANDMRAWRRYAEVAADLASETGDNQTAVGLFHELLAHELSLPATRRTDVLVRVARKLGEAAVSTPTPLSGPTSGVTAALRRVLTDVSLPADARGEIRLLLGRLLLATDENEAAYEEIEMTLPDLHRRPALAARAMLHLAWPLTRGRPAHWHRLWLNQATALLATVESPVPRLSLEVRRVTALLLLGQGQGWDAAADLPRSAATEFEQREIVQAMVNIAQCATVWGRYDEARERLAIAGELIDEVDFQRMRDTARIAAAHLDWYTGSWAGLAGTLAAFAGADGSRPGNVLEARTIQAQLDLARGARDAARRGLRAVADESARRGRIEPVILPGAALARLSIADGDVSEALRAVEPEMEAIARKEVWVWATDLAPVHTEALVVAGQLGRAEAMVSAFADGLDGCDAPAPAAAVMTCRAIVVEARAQWAQAAALFADAAVAWAALPRPYDALLASERQAGCLVASGEPEAGMEILATVERRMRLLGARWDADRVAHVLRRHGREVDRAWRGGRRGYGSQLSPREAEVVRLVADGLSNREVAEALYLSPKTVGHHVSSAMRKLCEESRTGLAVAAASAGLLSDQPPGGSGTVGLAGLSARE